MNLETFMTNNFSNYAKEQEKEMQNKTYEYKLFTGLFMDKLSKQGLCSVISRRYDRGLDCDVITIKDVTTGEIISRNQFALELKEIK